MLTVGDRFVSRVGNRGRVLKEDGAGNITLAWGDGSVSIENRRADEHYLSGFTVLTYDHDLGDIK